MILLPNKIELLENLEENNPKLYKVMKKYHRARFVDAGFYVLSQPQTHSHHQIYGIFVIDKDEVKKKLTNPAKNFSQIKQDFLIHISGATVKYYRGLIRGEKPDNVLRPIHEFCPIYNKSGKDYGCFYDTKTKKWFPADHHYYDENCSRLPGKKWIRDLITKVIKEVRQEILNSR